MKYLLATLALTLTLLTAPAQAGDLKLDGFSITFGNGSSSITINKNRHRYYNNNRHRHHQRRHRHRQQSCYTVRSHQQRGHRQAYVSQTFCNGRRSSSVVLHWDHYHEDRHHRRVAYCPHH